jgi:hypothetical protein
LPYFFRSLQQCCSEKILSFFPQIRWNWDKYKNKDPLTVVVIIVVILVIRNWLLLWLVLLELRQTIVYELLRWNAG